MLHKGKTAASGVLLAVKFHVGKSWILKSKLKECYE